MAESDQLMEAVIAIDKQVDELNDDRESLLKRWVLSVCPFKVGDTVTACGYSHAGKQCVITEVFAEPSWTKGLAYRWKAVGNVLKNDGTQSKKTTGFDASDWKLWQSRLANTCDISEVQLD